ncbi:hypothetical protein YPPY10_2432, partial [Yersinia pestis PY-10]
MILTNKN